MQSRPMLDALTNTHAWTQLSVCTSALRRTHAVVRNFDAKGRGSYRPLILMGNV